MAATNETDDQNQLIAVGARISQGPWRGTVRYVGLVPPTEGIWLGIEWDDASRGKHDGSHKGVRYFNCRHNTNAGSFIRPSSSKLSFGSSFLQAIRYKYVTEPEVENASNTAISAQQYSRKNLAEIEIEAPNMEGVRRRNAQLHRLREVGLGGWKMERGDDASSKGDNTASSSESFAEVARAFDEAHGEKEGDIARTCPNLRWLDLSRSLLPSWQELSNITKDLQHLETLLLHFNRFEPISQSEVHIQPQAFTNLKDLRADGTLISWQEMCQIGLHMPSLESIQAGENGLNMFECDLADQKSPFPQLRQINLANNQISNWPALLAALEICPKMERIILSDNEITSIPPVPHLTNEAKARKLLHISLNNNALQSWTDLENLDAWCLGLQSLSITAEHCPFLASLDPRDIRPLVVARLPHLQTLNHAAISQTERRDAELYYLSRMSKETAGMSSIQRDQLHPRLRALEEKYGKQEEAKSESNTKESSQKSTLRSKLLTIKIHKSTSIPTSKPPHFTSSESTEGTEVSLLTTTPIRLLQGKIARALGIKGGARSIESIWALLNDTKQQIRNLDDDRIIYPLENLDWDLSAYNITKDDQLIIVVNEN
ncbi:uncharacterized protein FA14DRAFT_146124 [Meira miltonrushii]|uniref:CAP-Gly domain-containing protein n=1 Tax=Meira miltonrushii TaxID=1280837 RepID=A0A316VEB6_9BASI|nr:uncharacterized protein FA14DRAFT_146124 [Meira miltonrushii]PWN35997.1 hypothetical protein FA14DRAFT_146124 [Meira miltonrushii]